MSLPRYLRILCLTALLVAFTVLGLPVVTKSQVRLGTVIEEDFHHDFTIETSPRMYLPLDASREQALEKAIRLQSTGSIKLQSVHLEVQAKDVRWSEGKNRSYTAPGGELLSKVRWEAVSGEQAEGNIRIHFPTPQAKIRSGSSYWSRDGDWEIRAITAHDSAISLAIGRMSTALTFAFWPALFIASIWAAVVFSRIQKAWIAAAPAASGSSLPREFHSNPNSPYETANVFVLIFSFIGTIIACIAMFDFTIMRAMNWVLLIILLILLLITWLCCWLVPKSMATVRLTEDRFAFAKGRKARVWQEAHWNEISSLLLKEKKVKNTTQYWLEIVFPNGKKHKINAGFLPEFHVMATLAQQLHRRHRSSTGQP